MKKVITLSFLFISFFSISFAQVTGKFEITVVGNASLAQNRALVQMRAVSNVLPEVSTCDVNDNAITDIVGGLTFGIKWALSTGISTVNDVSNLDGECPDIDPEADYGIDVGSGDLLSPDGLYEIKAFYAALTPSPITTDWILNEWVTICTLSITRTTPCDPCNDLDIYVQGEYPSLEGGSVIVPRISHEETAGNPVLYEALPNNEALPLNLLAFDVTKSGLQDVLVSWKTTNEFNTSHFNVERSFDRNHWTVIDNIPAAGNSLGLLKYSTSDLKVYDGVSNRLQVYYRLNMIDIDGKSKYSPIDYVVFGNSALSGREVVVYPNPASQGVHVEWDADLGQPTSLEFYDLSGKLAMTHRVGENSKQEYVDFTKVSMQPGLYMMRVMNGTEAIDHKQIIVGR